MRRVRKQDCNATETSEQENSGAKPSCSRNAHPGHNPLPPFEKRGTKNEVSRQSPRQREDSGTKTELPQEEGPQTRRSRRIETASNKESPGHEVAAIQLPSRPAFSSGITRNSCHNWALGAYFFGSNSPQNRLPSGESKLGCTFRPRSPLRPISPICPRKAQSCPNPRRIRIPSL